MTSKYSIALEMNDPNLPDSTWRKSNPQSNKNNNNINNIRKVEEEGKEERGNLESNNNGYSISGNNIKNPNNVNGGAWYFRVNKTDSARVWRELLMLLIGEQFEDHLLEDDDIFGLTVSSRATSDIFNIWNKNADASQHSTVLEKLKTSLSPTELQMPYYKAHSEHAAFKKTEPRFNRQR
ncbi:248_t:CDS:2 [Entrophospora sp. SA101]|nr:248_t:CDS:2 [Entrophospora sp. SA101]CAJ0844117.1 7364_t:CDS:2 [Entrophospora sp. SA101]